jgi:drug/metabolite transporter (DMT)-like permease
VTIHETLDLKAAALLTVLCLLWGLNGVAMKISYFGIAPIFCGGLRSLVAALGLALWMKMNAIRLFPGDLLDGIIVGVLFGVEFAFLYSALLFTTVSSASILLYTTPFFHALGAHFFLQGDRITPHKGIGLVLAFSGVVTLLSKHMDFPSPTELIGDLCAIVAAILWAATTIYVKRRLVERVSHQQCLFYQTLFSIPILFLLSFFFGETPVHHIDALIISSVAFQGVIVAFVSYLLWFHLVYGYPVSRLSAFTFLTPVFATIFGTIFLHEPMTLKLVFSLILVSLGIYVVNIK